EQVEQSLGRIEREIAQIRQSELYELKGKVEEAEEAGRDLLAEMAARLNEQIASARDHLAEITRTRS
ncbi:molecular chaperone DnaJ, partial [Acidobacteria bacterium AH-259-D05]|nr:molecular chaperone DnaJ [Acidobacteria bacterium AH-259-D05]